MKKIVRMLVFSAVAIYITAYWNKGFIIDNNWLNYLKAAMVIAAVYYLITPFSKLILLPLNIITFGLVSVVFYSLVLYFLLNNLALTEIKAWNFAGLSLWGLIVVPLTISQLSNIFLSAFSISTIISLLERLL